MEIYLIKSCERLVGNLYYDEILEIIHTANKLIGEKVKKLNFVIYLLITLHNFSSECN